LGDGGRGDKKEVKRGEEGRDGEKRVFKYVKERQGQEGSRANLVLPTKAERENCPTFIS
jgi:hypothetical protein